MCYAVIEKTKNCNYFHYNSIKCQKKTTFCYICGELLKTKDLATHYLNNSPFSKCKKPLSNKKDVVSYSVNQPKKEVEVFGSFESDFEEEEKVENKTHSQKEIKEDKKIFSITTKNDSVIPKPIREKENIFLKCNLCESDMRINHAIIWIQNVETFFICRKITESINTYCKFCGKTQRYCKKENLYLTLPLICL